MIWAIYDHLNLLFSVLDSSTVLYKAELKHREMILGRQCAFTRVAVALLVAPHSPMKGKDTHSLKAKNGRDVQ
jgi:hypothetical protein